MDHILAKNLRSWYLKIAVVLLLLLFSLILRWQNVDYHTRGAPFPFFAVTPGFSYVNGRRSKTSYSVNYEALAGDVCLFYLAVSAFRRRKVD